jgi:Mce-associated membrane protein
MTKTLSRSDSTARDLSATALAPKRMWRARWMTRRLLTGVVMVALACCCASTSLVYIAMYRPDQQTTRAAADTAIKAASAGTVAVLSYKSDTAQSDFATAKAYLTGDFLTYFEQFTQQVVTPALQQKGVRTTAAVVKAGVNRLDSDSASVLLFVNQTTSSVQNPEPRIASSSVNVGLRNVHGQWLISSFDPV